MTTKWLPSLLCLLTIALPTINGCLQSKGLISAKCNCDEQADYSQITCPLPPNSTFSIIMSKDNKYEIYCKNQIIKNIDLIPTLYEKNTTIDYYGYKNCSAKEFNAITEKLFLNSRKFKVLEFTHIDEIYGYILEPYEIDTLSIENSYFDVVPENLLKHVPGLTALQITGIKNLVEIPEDIFTFTKNIEVINLGSNNIKNVSVNLFANLTKLTQLQLFANQIQSIDETLFRDLHNLEKLELMTNQIEELPESIFKNLPKLEIVSLRKNRFQTLPENLFLHNPRLKSIQLMDNPFSGELPEKLFANSLELEDVQLHYCNLMSLQQNIFSNNPKLKTINLSNNKLKYLNKNIFGILGNLEILYLQNNKLEILDDNVFENTRQLQTLDLSYNKIQVNDFTFNGLRNLMNLNLKYNSLSDLSVRSFSFFRRLVKLDMSYNNITLRRKEKFGLTDHSILPQLDSLQFLYLKNNSITSIFSDWSLNLLQLKELDLSNNKITDLNYNDLQFLQDEKLVVHLENNEITTINLSSAELLLQQNIKYQKGKRQIYVEGNPIHCDCRIYDFIRYLDKTMPSFVYDVLEIDIGGDMACQSPKKYKGQKLNEINSKHLTCTLHDVDPILPKRCSMQHYEYQMFEKRLIVNCSNNGLTKLPKILLNRSDINFAGQEIKVYMSGNNITSMPGPNMGYENVVELDLSHNNIGEITWVPPKIQILRLDHNNLTYLTNAELSMINQTTIRNVSFHNNPWICDCQLVNFTKYLQENFQKIPKLHNITCANTIKRRELTRLSPEDLCPYSTLLIIVICAILVFVAMITSILIAMYYRYKTHIKVWLYAHNLCLYLITEEEVDQDKPYDAFISFSHEDEDFVVNELMAGLESGPHPFKLCVHFRDFQPGEFITRNIARSIEASRRTVVVVSKGFLRSEWGKMEFRTAHTEALKEGRARVIMIVYGDLGPIDDLDPEIKAYLSTNTYVKWGSPWFWDNLRFALPHLSKYARLSDVVVNQPIPQLKRKFDDKSDLIYEPTTPPAATTPPADSLRLHDPLLTPSALNVSLINGSLVNNLQKNNNLYNLDVCT